MTRLNHPRSFATIAAALFFAFSASACENAKPNIPAYVRSIGIPVFVNRSKTPGIELDVTQRVLHEFMSTSELAVTPNAGEGDAELLGEIYDYQKLPISWDQTNRIVQYKILIKARVSFKDNKTGEIRWHTDDIDGVTSFSLLATPPETEESAIFKAADELARDIFFLVYKERQYTEDDLIFSDVTREASVRPGEVARR